MKKRILPFLACLVLLVSVCACGIRIPIARAPKVPTTYPYVFVHGLNGFGDDAGSPVSYWGATGGALLPELKKEGYSCFAPSVSAAGSAWDRACELYAAVTGTRVDYGAAHSAEAGHDRYGKTYETALVPDWGVVDGNNNLRKINLIAHSFGGATARLFCSLLQNGSAAERGIATREGGELPQKISVISPLFEGGKGDWVFSLTCLAAPHNGVSLLAMADVNPLISIAANLLSNAQIDSALSALGVNIGGKSLGDILEAAKTKDTAYYDLTLAGAKLVNQQCSINPNTYYFSYPVDGTDHGVPTDDMMGALQILARMIGNFTDEGLGIDETWLPNDGLVNTISATAPFGQPSQTVADAATLAPAALQPANWYVMPTVRGDHGSIIGLARKMEETLPLYNEQIQRIDALSKQVTG